jgi:phosphohistidine phosphatase
VDLFLIRHAQAASLMEAGVIEDANRPLTEAGKIQAKELATCFQRRKIQPSVLVTSPLLRARETAEHIVKDWHGAPDIRICEELAPGGKRRRLARFLRDLGAECAALVGHQPDLGEFAGWLIGSKKVQIDIPKAGVAFIRCEDLPAKGEGTLEWLIGPEWFGANNTTEATS